MKSIVVTSKHGLIGYTKTLAAEWGGRGVRVDGGWIADASWESLRMRTRN
jgi:NAD(P)-dependent dehydrogenase (short-subunit alcohol dehydrogenase family)